MVTENVEKAPNVEQITVQMDEVDQLLLQNKLYKIQLEQERVKVAKLQLTNAELVEQMASQELKMWEAQYKLKLAANKYDIQKLSIDADTGTVMMLVLPKQMIDGTRPSKSNGKVAVEQSAGA